MAEALDAVVLPLVPLLGLAGVLLGAATTAVTRDLRTGLAVALDLLLAAGLLRLGMLRTWTDLLVAAALVALRQLASLGLRASGAHGLAPVWAQVRDLAPVWAGLRSPAGGREVSRARPSGRSPRSRP